MQLHHIVVDNRGLPHQWVPKAQYTVVTQNRPDVVTTTAAATNIIAYSPLPYGPTQHGSYGAAMGYPGGRGPQQLPRTTIYAGMDNQRGGQSFAAAHNVVGAGGRGSFNSIVNYQRFHRGCGGITNHGHHPSSGVSRGGAQVGSVDGRGGGGCDGRLNDPWACPICKKRNWITHTKCKRCSAQRPVESVGGQGSTKHDPVRATRRDYGTMAIQTARVDGTDEAAGRSKARRGTSSAKMRETGYEEPRDKWDTTDLTSSKGQSSHTPNVLATRALADHVGGRSRGGRSGRLSRPWYCQNCGNHNWSFREACNKCPTLRPGGVSLPTQDMPATIKLAVPDGLIGDDDDDASVAVGDNSSDEGDADEGRSDTDAPHSVDAINETLVLAVSHEPRSSRGLWRRLVGWGKDGLDIASECTDIMASWVSRVMPKGDSLSPEGGDGGGKSDTGVAQVIRCMLSEQVSAVSDEARSGEAIGPRLAAWGNDGFDIACECKDRMRSWVGRFVEKAAKRIVRWLGPWVGLAVP